MNNKNQDNSRNSPIGHQRPWANKDIAPFIRIEGLSKRFGDFTAVNQVDLDIYQGELFSILGGSGSGKTTLLRMLAGFEEPSGGKIIIDGEDMTGIPAYRRPVNMMFQSYALFPHMTVARNVAYGLKRDRVARQEIQQRVEDVLELVQMSEFAHRKPAQLSGGQRQRVALARSLVKSPKALLLDEPLGALDRKLRENTQFELANIQYRTGITFIVVTHDQEEAMTLSTRIAVMDQGRFHQVGEPGEVYENPRTRFTADFIGKINSFEATVTGLQGDQVSLEVPVLKRNFTVPAGHPFQPGDSACLAVRPEKIHIAREAPAEEHLFSLTGTVIEQGYFGNLSVYRVQLDGGEVIQVSAQNRVRSAQRAIDWEETVHVYWDRSSMVVLSE